MQIKSGLISNKKGQITPLKPAWIFPARSTATTAFPAETRRAQSKMKTYERQIIIHQACALFPYAHPHAKMKTFQVNCTIPYAIHPSIPVDSSEEENRIGCAGKMDGWAGGHDNELPR